jgi:tetratricopeptide (TPR) repeat protein
VTQGDPALSVTQGDPALSVTQGDPALTDLRLLLQINKAVALCNLDQYEQAFAAAGEARRLADSVGTAIRLAQAHGALGQLLYNTGRWDEVLAEVETLPVNLKEPGGACHDLAMAAVIRFHRSEISEAHRLLAAAAPHAERADREVHGLAAGRPVEAPFVGERVDEH